MRVTYRSATSVEVDQLEIPTESQVLVIGRLFLSEDCPVIYSTNILPTAIISGMLVVDNVILSIYDFLSSHAGQEIHYSTTDISAQVPDEEISSALELPYGTPILRFSDVFYNRDEQPVAIGLNYYNEKILGMRLVRQRS
jgi:GntR family transcriptional regulator